MQPPYLLFSLYSSISSSARYSSLRQWRSARDLFCISLGFCYFELHSKINCASEIKINGIYFVFRSAFAIFANNNLMKSRMAREDYPIDPESRSGFKLKYVLYGVLLLVCIMIGRGLLTERECSDEANEVEVEEEPSRKLTTTERLDSISHENVVKQAQRLGVSTEGSTSDILERINHAKAEKQAQRERVSTVGSTSEDLERIAHENMK